MLDGKPQCVQRQPDLERKGNRGGDNEHDCEHKPNGGKRRRVEPEVGAEDVRRNEKTGAAHRHRDGEHGKTKVPGSAVDETDLSFNVRLDVKRLHALISDLDEPSDAVHAVTIPVRHAQNDHAYATSVQNKFRQNHALSAGSRRVSFPAWLKIGSSLLRYGRKYKRAWIVREAFHEPTNISRPFSLHQKYKKRSAEGLPSGNSVSVNDTH